ncbi:hypothetical protein EZV62_005531 [Acer yangbiense]|uniref:PGG domain-containing protein n=1 Tax=Acer yangbiense TaxID=1000413 RepID=A0A5C7IQ59_9ROSI|nr:hypothetical protein EZV62_005531 [Acer yangbiense]
MFGNVATMILSITAVFILCTALLLDVTFVTVLIRIALSFLVLTLSFMAGAFSSDICLRMVTYEVSSIKVYLMDRVIQYYHWLLVAKTMKKLQEMWLDATEFLCNRGKSILHVPAMRGKEERVSCILKEKTLDEFVNKMGKDRNTPLHLEALSKDGNTPLHLEALSCNHVVMVTLLYYKQSKLDVVNNQGLTTYDLYILKESQKIWTLKDLNKTKSTLEAALIVDSAYAGSLQMSWDGKSMLDAFGPSHNGTDFVDEDELTKYGLEKLLLAQFMFGNVAAMILSITAVFILCTALLLDATFATVLIRIALSFLVLTLSFMAGAFSNDISLRMRNNNGLYPLHLACENGKAKTMKKLLKMWLDTTEFLCTRGRSILHVSAMRRKEETVSCILKEKALDELVNKMDKDENTHLHLEAMGCNHVVVHTLLYHKQSKLDIVNNQVLTAYDLFIFSKAALIVGLAYVGSLQMPWDGKSMLDAFAPSHNGNDFVDEDELTKYGLDKLLLAQFMFGNVAAMILSIIAVFILCTALLLYATFATVLIRIAFSFLVLAISFMARAFSSDISLRMVTYEVSSIKVYLMDRVLQY